MRKATVVILLCFVWMGLVLAVSCEKSEPQPTDNNGNGIIIPEEKDTNISLQGTNWKLVGIFDAETDTLIKELEPKQCNICYILEFRDTNTIHLRTTTNGCVGTYEVDYNTNEIRIIKLICSCDGEWHEDGYLYNDICWRQLYKIQSFSSRAEELKWYYNYNTYYLKYKPWEL